METPPRVNTTSIFQEKVSKAGGHLLEAAIHILEKVNREHGSGDAYLDKIWGRSITRSEAVCTMKSYSKSEHLSDILRIRTSSSLGCSAHVVSYGSPQRKLYHVTVDCSEGNCYLRDKAILGLAFHEIGTHVLRAHNDGFQVWHRDRRRFGLSKPSGKKMLLTEEGLATINTHLPFSSHLLWMPALLYYAVYRAQHSDGERTMFDLSNYIHNRPLRERIVRRIKAQSGFERVGGSVHDQCYFSGAVKLLLNLETLDLPLLHCGKLAMEDVARVKRISKTSTLPLPSFLTDLSQYVGILQEMRSVNELSMVCKQ